MDDYKSKIAYKNTCENNDFFSVTKNVSPFLDSKQFSIWLSRGRFWCIIYPSLVQKIRFIISKLWCCYSWSLLRKMIYYIAHHSRLYRKILQKCTLMEAYLAYTLVEKCAFCCNVKVVCYLIVNFAKNTWEHII